MVTEKELLRHVLKKAPPQNARLARRLCTEIRFVDASEKHFCVCRMLITHYSFLSPDLSPAGVAFDKAGETEVDGGDAGFSGSPDPNPARRL